MEAFLKIERTPIIKTQIDAKYRAQISIVDVRTNTEKMFEPISARTEIELNEKLDRSEAELREMFGEMVGEKQ